MPDDSDSMRVSSYQLACVCLPCVQFTVFSIHSQNSKKGQLSIVFNLHSKLDAFVSVCYGCEDNLELLLVCGLMA